MKVYPYFTTEQGYLDNVWHWYCTPCRQQFMVYKIQ